jgi:hypothetical protein
VSGACCEPLRQRNCQAGWRDDRFTGVTAKRAHWLTSKLPLASDRKWPGAALLRQGLSGRFAPFAAMQTFAIERKCA